MEGVIANFRSAVILSTRNSLVYLEIDMVYEELESETFGHDRC